MNSEDESKFIVTCKKLNILNPLAMHTPKTEKLAFLKEHPMQLNFAQDNQLAVLSPNLLIPSYTW